MVTLDFSITLFIQLQTDKWYHEANFELSFHSDLGHSPAFCILDIETKAVVILQSNN